MEHDAIGPGTPAWEASDQAIRDGVNGRDMQPAIDDMTRHLIDAGFGPTKIREWEAFIAERVAAPGLDDFD